MVGTGCAVIPGDLGGVGDFIFQSGSPTAHTGGRFEVLAGNENQEFLICSIEGNCEGEGLGPVCDQLVVRPTRDAIGLKSTIQLQYTNLSIPPVNFAFDYGKDSSL